MGQGALQQRLLDRLQGSVGDLGAATRRAAGPQRGGAVGLPAGMPAAGALAGDVQLAGDLGLGAAPGEQLGGAFSAGLPCGPLLGGALSCLLLAAVGGHAADARTPATRRHLKVKESNKRQFFWFFWFEWLGAGAAEDRRLGQGGAGSAEPAAARARASQQVAGAGAGADAVFLAAPQH
jgi:hypothetical protein